MDERVDACEEQTLLAKDVDQGIIRIRDLCVEPSVRSDRTCAAREELAQIAIAFNQRLDSFKLGYTTNNAKARAFFRHG